ncbi:UNVERIFIED_CONTAM: hypothetical protein Scaly_2462200 [Sesamum calycinum]
MEPVREEMKTQNVTFVKSQVLGGKDRNVCSYKQLEIPKSPNHAMEFLSRSWSPSASDFQHNLLLSRDTKEQDDRSLKSGGSTNTTIIQQDSIKMDFKHPKTWLRGKSLTTLLRSLKEQKKEEKRLHTAQLHAALSLTQLAAAIAGTTSSVGKQESSPFQNGRTGVPSQDMGDVLSSAAALLTNVCAETAESLGAHKGQVRTAVESGMAIQSPIDLIAVTATAATCLRGVSLLKSRAMEDPFSRIQQMLKISAEICTIMPSDQITNITEERREHQGNSLLCLKTKNGIIKLVFEDEMQSKIWISTILNLLEMRNPSPQRQATPTD